MRARDALELLLLAGLWSASFLFLRMAVPEFGPLALIETRVAVAAAVLLPVFLWHVRVRPRGRELGHVAALGVINTLLPFVLVAYAIQTLSAGLTSILNATSPLFGAVVAWLWLRDRLDRWRVLGLAIGFGGVVLLLGDRATLAAGGSPSATTLALALAAALAGPVLYGIGASYARRFLHGVHPMQVAALSQVSAALLLAPLGWASWPVVAPAPLAWGAAIALGALCTGLAYVLYFRLIASLGPARAISVTFLVPPFGMLWGHLVLDEAVGPRMIAGAAVILAGTALATGLLRPGRRAQPAAPKSGLRFSRKAPIPSRDSGP